MNSPPFPSALNSQDKSSLVELSKRNTRVTYIGPGKTDGDAGSVRSNLSIPPTCIFYYEISIISKGRDGFIGLGFSTTGVSLNRLPGWEVNSWGYHGDDGKAFCSSGTGKSFGPKFTTGDVIGCGIDFCKNEIWYTKNGIWLGVAFKGEKFDGMQVYCSVGMRTPGEIVECNFGQKPFVFDLDGFVSVQKEKLLGKIAGRKLAKSLDVKELIVDYLNHFGYTKTLQAMDCVQDASHAQLDVRVEIRQAILVGEMDRTIQLLTLHYPNLLVKNEFLLFQLYCRKFVELIQANELSEAMAFGQTLQTKFNLKNNEKMNQILMNTYSLLAYADPKKSKASYLLSQGAREELAEFVNSAVLVEEGKSGEALLERVLKQCVVVGEELKKQKVAQGFLVDFRKEYLERLSELENGVAKLDDALRGLEEFFDENGVLKVEEAKQEEGVMDTSE